MGIACNGEIREILERLRTSFSFDHACECIPAEHLRDFDIEQMRCMQRLAHGEKAKRGSEGRVP